MSRHPIEALRRLVTSSAWWIRAAAGGFLVASTGGGCVQDVSIRTLGPINVELSVLSSDEPTLRAEFLFGDAEIASVYQDSDCTAVDARIGFDDTTVDEGLELGQSERVLYWGGGPTCTIDDVEVSLSDAGGAEGTFWLESAGERFEVTVFVPPDAPQLTVVERSATADEPAVLEMSGYEFTALSATFEFSRGGADHELLTTVGLDADRAEVTIIGLASDEEACGGWCQGSLKLDYAYQLPGFSCEGFNQCTNVEGGDEGDSVLVTWTP